MVKKILLDKLWLWRNIRMIVIDAGNSKVKIAIFKNEKIVKKAIFDTKKCLEHKFIRRVIFEDIEVDVIAFSSVVPEVTDGIISISKELKKKYFDVNKAKNKVLKINYEEKELGGDRLANAVAAYKRYNPPLLIIDFGTATTYNIILADGTFDGGIIAPGIKTCIDFLIQNTGLLQEIPLKYPDTFPGHTTVDALIAGFYYTFSGQMKEILKNVQKHIGSDYITIGTGGLVEFAIRDFPHIIQDEDLTLLGIKMLYGANNER
ncbi:MAG: type III pantothenate kinase [Candidatus Cloacimonadota bacterium]|nr:MAG: type III pantothenate kinase [Candidatus Cloacimonadota bacterium]